MENYIFEGMTYRFHILLLFDVVSPRKKLEQTPYPKYLDITLDKFSLHVRTLRLKTENIC